MKAAAASAILFIHLPVLGFSIHSFAFMKEGKDDGKKRMMRTWGHILNGLCEVLKNDHKIRPGVFDENFIEMQFAEILFSLMLVSVIREDYVPLPLPRNWNDGIIYLSRPWILEKKVSG